MADVRVVLSGLWVAVMLTYLLGDVLRLMAGDMTPGEIEGRTASQGMWLGIAVIMLIPIIMVVLSLTLPYPAIGWVTSSWPCSSSCSTCSGCPTKASTTTS